uniref:Uncharacterized protein n=1 Tax=Candidatus Methanogaster sp. ANME-2c ERB4 TaxID=2759911 RepID=A0A7G9Y983_9EURY|nr:hypothetical protein KKOBALHG_00004 [Methanosarcinales archaeon ANME-2c ERB4]QNO45098.1 hypothetical protein HICMJNBA_00004 [Methanosarcinales archaeon ANME-2c ERB4]
MNDRNPNHNEQQQDERPFAYILKRALLHQHQQDEKIETSRYQPPIPEYQITIEHGSIWLEQECAASTR